MAGQPGARVTSVIQWNLYLADTVLSGHPLLSGQQPKSRILFPLFTLNETFIKRTRTPKKYLKWSFLLLPTCINSIPPPNMPITSLPRRRFYGSLFVGRDERRAPLKTPVWEASQSPEMRKIASNCHLQIFRFLHWKTWLDELILLVSQYSIVFYFVLFVQSLFTHFWFLQIWVAIYVYGTMINWSTLIWKLPNANVYRHSLWECSKRFYCSFEWHLTPHLTLSIETCIRGTPCIKRTLQHYPRASA